MGDVRFKRARETPPEYEELLTETEAAAKKHFTRSDTGGIADFPGVNLDMDVHVEFVGESGEWRQEITCIKGAYLIDQSGYLITVRPISPPYSTAGEDEIQLELKYVLAGKDEYARRVSIAEVATWAAINEARDAGDVDKANRLIAAAYGNPHMPNQGKRRAERKSPTPNSKNTGMNLPTTKLESYVFGTTKDEEPFRPTDYKGRNIAGEFNIGTAKPVKHRHGNDLLLQLENELVVREVYEPVKAQDRIFMDAIVSIIEDNGEMEVRGSDILKRLGIKKPLKPGHSGTMQEALDACLKFESTDIIVDTTDKKAAKGRKNYGSITKTRLLSCDITAEWWDDGNEQVRDFTVKLRPEAGSTDPRSALPLLIYAKSANEIHPMRQELFEVAGIRSMNERRMALTVYRHVSSAGKGMKHADTMKLDTLLKQCGIEPSKDTRYKAKKGIKKILNGWQDAGAITQWGFTLDGNKNVDGFKIDGFSAERVMEIGENQPGK